mgnify:CR=1 FL=1
MTKTKYAALYLVLLMGCIQIPLEIEQPDIIPLDSIDQLTNKTLALIHQRNTSALEAIDSVTAVTNVSQAELSDIYEQINNRQILIMDTTIQRIHYTDTTIQRIRFMDVIKYDTIRDTLYLMDTIVTIQQRRRKKRK